MMLLIILLILSTGLNLVLVYLIVRKHDKKRLNIRINEDFSSGRVEYFELHNLDSFQY